MLKIAILNDFQFRGRTIYRCIFAQRQWFTLFFNPDERFRKRSIFGKLFLMKKVVSQKVAFRKKKN